MSIQLYDIVLPNPNTGFIFASGACRYTHAYVMSVNPLILISEEGDMAWFRIDISDIQTFQSLCLESIPLAVLDRCLRSNYADVQTIKAEVERRSSSIKQVIVMRKDLRNTKGEKVRTGKLMAQAAHASLESYKKTDKLLRTTWETYSAYKKIVLAVNSNEELLELYSKLDKAKLSPVLILDSGLTEFSEPTYTCLAVLATTENLQDLTVNLSLF